MKTMRNKVWAMLLDQIFSFQSQFRTKLADFSCCFCKVKNSKLEQENVFLQYFTQIELFKNFSATLIATSTFFSFFFTLEERYMETSGQKFFQEFAISKK